ncbi:Di-copper centre-containing protein [Acephala macrosclerotiorum]|nr:Di-copper centre-containing protein [Acephala macrosclerotiorum]
MASSPVFDRQLGFGSNGDSVLGESPVGGGHCVTDGPFAMTLARYVGLEVKPHCLSRNFRNDTKTGHFTGHLIRPDLVEKYLDEDDLLLFTLKLETGPHNTIPFGIRGDFLSFNAPADPLFFLHHAQLDRLWWKWQHIKPERRNSYSTMRSLKSDEMTSLNDLIKMDEMAEDMTVSKIIDTEQGLLCYSYED